MKKVIFLLLVALYTIGLNAQGVKFGVFTGVNVSSPSKLNSKLGFHIGAKGEFLFHNNIYLETGLSLGSKGWKANDYYDAKTEQIIEFEGNPYYLEVPIHLGYKIPVGKSFKILGNIGPYFGWGMFGKQSYSIISKAKETKHSSNNLFKDNVQERLDFGIGAKLGIEYNNHYQFSLGYDLGLKEIYKEAQNKIDSKNRIFNISFTYLF